MRRLPRLALAALLSLAAHGLAAETWPHPLPSDPRIRRFVYDENTVYRLDVTMKFISSIHFEEGEIVESIQVGDSASWQIERLNRGDVVSIKPLIVNAHTNMTVMTDRRVYTFDLRARRAPSGSAAPNYRVGFTYPSDDVTEFAAALGGARGPGRSFDYHVAGSAPFRPVEVFDDGRRTFFRFPADTPRPAIFRVDAERRESVVNARHAGDQVIVDGVSDRWTVRIGEEALCVASGTVAQTQWARADAPEAGRD